MDETEGSTSRDCGNRGKRGRGGKFLHRPPPAKVPKMGDNPEVTSSSASEAEKPELISNISARGRRRKNKPSKADVLPIPGQSEEPSSTTTSDFADGKPKGTPRTDENLIKDKSLPAAPMPDVAKSAWDICTGPETSSNLSLELESSLDAALRRSAESAARPPEERQSEFFQAYRRLQTLCKMTQTDAFSDDTASSPDVDSSSDDGNESDDDDSDGDPDPKDGAGKKEDPGAKGDANSNETSGKENCSNYEGGSRGDGGSDDRSNSNEKTSSKNTDCSKDDPGESKCHKDFHSIDGTNVETHNKNESTFICQVDGRSNNQCKRKETRGNGLLAGCAIMDNRDIVCPKGFCMRGKSDTTFVISCIELFTSHIGDEHGNTMAVAGNDDVSHGNDCSSEGIGKGINNMDVNNVNSVSCNNGNNACNSTNSNNNDNKEENNDNEYHGNFESISNDDSSGVGDFEEEEISKEIAVANPPPEPLWPPAIKMPQLMPTLVYSPAMAPPRPVNRSLPQQKPPMQSAPPQGLPRQGLFPFGLRHPLLPPLGHSTQGLHPQGDPPKGTASPFPGLPSQSRQGVGPLELAPQDVFPRCGPSQGMVPAHVLPQGARTQAVLPQSALAQGPPLQGFTIPELDEDLHDVTLHSLFCEAPLPPFPYRLMDFIDITEEVDLLGLFD